MFGFLGDLLGLNKGEATKDAASQNQEVITNYGNTGRGIINAGADKAGGYLQQVTDLYSGQIDRGKQGTALYDDAMGLNGAEGNARATGAFQTSPGYDFARDQGLQALDRRASSMGSYQSGGTMADVMDYATGTANKEYGSWLSRLGGYEGTLNAGTAGKAGGLNNQANLATGTATQQLGLEGDVASGTMGATNQWAQGEEANKAGIASFGGNLLGMAGKAFGWGGF